MLGEMVHGTTRPTSEIEQDWRFADLVVRSWVDSGLTVRYDADPHAVLQEFGLHLDAGVRPPALPTEPAEDLVIEDLEHSSAPAVPTGFCNAA
jgi:putative thiazole/oxazole-modified microcin (TOMM)-like peptide